MSVRVGTRGSALARAQTDEVVRALQGLHPGTFFEVVPITTSGDRSQASGTPGPDWGSGVFVRDIEAALLRGEVDLAVHSLKDLPPVVADRLCLAAVPARADPRDVLVTADGRGFDDLARGAVVGTASSRRVAFLKAARPDLRFRPVRGNVDTRCRKLLAGDFDALVLAQAGLGRLRQAAHGPAAPAADAAPRRRPADAPGPGPQRREDAPAAVTGVTALPIDVSVLPPAPGQGALAVETRASDADLRRLAAPLHDAATGAATSAERRAMAELGGGCRLPVAALGQVDASGALRLHVAVAAPDGSDVLRADGVGDPADPEGLGRRLAGELRAAGADRLMALAVSA
jgi:hydroxymethylbilane synthase